MSDEVEESGRKMSWLIVKMLCMHWNRGIEENNEKLEAGGSRTRGSCVNHSATTVGDV
jgi:hypothetical protein